MNEEFVLNSKFKPSEDQSTVIDTLTSNLTSGHEKQVLLGVTGSGKTFVMANIISKLQRPTLILSHNKTLAAQLYEEFKQFFPNNAVKYFVSYYDYYQPEAYIPSRDLYIEKESEVNEEIEKLRLSAMNAARTRRDTIVVASVSCIYNIGSPDNYENKSIEIHVGQEIDIGKLASELTHMRYERESTDLISGTFLIRGDIVELFMPYEEFPVRIEFFGNEIENIAYIEPISKQKINGVDNLDIFPATPLVYDADTMAQAVTNVEKDLEQRVSFLKNLGKEVEAQRLEQKTRYDIEMMTQIGFCKSMENYSIYFDGRKTGQPPYTLLDYFPSDYLLFIDESHITIPQVGGMYNGDRARKTNLIEHGFRLPSAYDNRPLNFNEFRKKQKETIYYSATPDIWEIQDSGNTVVELLTRPTGLLDPSIDVRKTQNQIDDVISEVKKNTEKGERVLITTLTKRMAEDLTTYLQDFGIKVAYLHSDIDTVERVEILRNLRLGEYDVLVGINLLREGIDLPEVSLVIILEADREGFLRSKTSLVQTIGRAARHINGRVIVYADKVTESMKFAIDETTRRRKTQEQYNIEHNITPVGVQKDIRDSLVEQENQDKKELDIEVEKLSEKQRRMLIKDLRGKMLLAAENLQFESGRTKRQDKGIEYLSLILNNMILDPFHSYMRYLKNNKDKYEIEEKKIDHANGIFKFESNIQGIGKYHGYPLKFKAVVPNLSDGMTLLHVYTSLENANLPHCVVGYNSILNPLYLNSRIYLSNEYNTVSKNSLILGKLRVLTDDINHTYYSNLLSPFKNRFESICKTFLTSPFFVLYKNEIIFIKSMPIIIKEENIDDAISLMTDLADTINRIK